MCVSKGLKLMLLHLTNVCVKYLLNTLRVTKGTRPPVGDFNSSSVVPTLRCTLEGSVMPVDWCLLDTRGSYYVVSIGSDLNSRGFKSSANDSNVLSSGTAGLVEEQSYNT